MNDQGLLYIFIEPDTTTNTYYKDDGIIDVHIFANSMGYDVEYHRQLSNPYWRTIIIVKFKEQEVCNG